MTTTAAAEISKEQLRDWQRRNAKGEIPCTPVLLVSAGHGLEHGGRIVLNVIENTSFEFALLFLRRAVSEIEAEFKQGN